MQLCVGHLEFITEFGRSVSYAMNINAVKV